MATDKVTLKKIQVVDEIKPGDFILVETPNGTRLIDYTNFVVGQDNITFDPLLSSFDSDIRGLSAQVIAQDAVNLSTFTYISAGALSLFSTLSTDLQATIVSLTATQADFTVVSNQVDVNTTDIASLSASVNSDSASIAANTADTLGLLACIAQIAAISANWNSVYTTVHINSAASTWHN